MKKVTLNHNGFHGINTVSFIPQKIVNIDIEQIGEPGIYWEVSPRVAKRLNATVCGMSDCTCYEQITIENHAGRHFVPIQGDYEIRGNYLVS